MGDVTVTAERTDGTVNPQQLLQLVGFYIGNEYFGVDILMVQEIIRNTPITHIPDAPTFIEGVINLRGSIIPVIDLRKRLGLKENKDTSDPWILILNVDGRLAGFMVDWVREVMKIDSDLVKPPPEIVLAGLKSQYIQGVCQLDKGLLILLDFNRILLVEEIRKLKGINAEHPGVSG